jgi:hypothetical protein
VATVNGKTSASEHGVLQSVWALGNADTGTPDQLARFPYHSVQISGTFGGATVVLEGSDDGVTYFTVSDVQAQPVSTSSAKRYDVTDVPKHLRPRSSGGSGTAVTVTITSRSFGH